MSFATAGVAPEVMGLGPVEAVPKALAKAGLTLDDIGVIELNEAFAAQVVAVVRRLGMDEERTNVNGGAIALGHPLGATGAKLTVQVLSELARREERYGLVTMCVGGGQGAAGVIEWLGGRQPVGRAGADRADGGGRMTTTRTTPPAAASWWPRPGPTRSSRPSGSARSTARSARPCASSSPPRSARWPRPSRARTTRPTASCSRRLGADGYVGVEVPEAHGGAGLDTVTSVIVSESLSAADSFAVTYLAHAGIGTLPLVFFGTEEQRARYLPGLAAGTTVGAYALTEPGSGSDARAMRTTAAALPDGGYRLDGTKQFITNAGFADLFTLYARLEDGGIAAFLVERDSPGLTVGPEEHKMGIKGSSTCQVILEGVEVPADALLGEPGEGHKIAFNILNVGRFKLAAAALGGMKRSLEQATAYAKQREAFGRPIAGFPLVAAKLAGMATRTYAVESVTYRIAGMLDARLEAAEEAGSEAFRAALEEYAVECSIAKVLGSEELDWTVDQLVQVHGGYGYTAEFPAERAYRDARINRIWEGTNEINRLLVPGTLVKRAMQGRLDLLGPAKRAAEALLAGGADDAPDDGPLAAEAALVAGARTVALLCAGAAFQRFGTGLEEQQEVLADLADLSIDLFAAESALLRAQAAAGRDDAAVHADLARATVHERAAAIDARARALAGSLAEGDEARMLQSGVRRLMRADPVDRVALGRAVAERTVAARWLPCIAGRAPRAPGWRATTPRSPPEIEVPAGTLDGLAREAARARPGRGGARLPGRPHLVRGSSTTPSTASRGRSPGWACAAASA